MKRLIFLLSALTVSAIGTRANAQIADCNAFLQGNYVEVGINWNGAFGSSADAPSGYHPKSISAGALYNSPSCDTISNGDSLRLGFVADPAMDGWTTGTPAYFGDYFLPGVPQEGWSIMADSLQGDAWNDDLSSVPGSGGMGLVIPYTTFSLTYDSVSSSYDTLWYTAYTPYAPSVITGTNISYSAGGGTATSTWEGTFDSIAITQITTLDTGALFFSVQVIITNMATTARNNVYYLRTVDPDNEEPETGSYITKNVIENQLPNAGNLSVVSAAGVTYPDAYLALGTNDTRAKVCINRLGLFPHVGTLDQIFSGDTTDYIYGQGDSLTEDVAINLLFNIGHLAAVDTLGAIDSAARTSAAATAPNRTVINYFYAFKQNANSLGVNTLKTPNMILYPNPATSNITLTNLDATDHLRLLDMMGKSVKYDFGNLHDGTNTFNISGLSSGTYILQVLDMSGQIKKNMPLQKL
jgi:hypothetical protein